MEYGGPWRSLALTVPERATITNMGAELGATSSIFPSDENTRVFLFAQGQSRDADWKRAWPPTPMLKYDERRRHRPLGNCSLW